MKHQARKFAASLLFPLLCSLAAQAGWTRVESGTLAWLHAVHFVDRQNGWAAGSSGTLLKTTDGGRTWRKEPKPTDDNVRQLAFADARRGWLLCERSIYTAGALAPSYVLETADGGASWTRVDFPKSVERIARVFFAPAGNAFAVGESGAFWTRADGLSDWKKSELPVRFLMLDGKFADAARGLIVGGGGTALFTENGGGSWNLATFSDAAKTKLNAVFFVDQNRAWTVGQEGRIYATTNGGKSWQRQATEVSENLFDVVFLDRAEGVAVGDGGTILRTNDGGQNWKLETTPVKHRLDEVFFVGRTGFAVGFGGTILTTAEAAEEKPRLNRGGR